jgi:hypothetical protein
MSAGAEKSGAADHEPVAYLARIRTYYAALGYGAPYEWAHHASVPFHALDKPLSECRVALVTTAAPYQPDKGDQGPGASYNAAAKFYKVYSLDSAKDMIFASRTSLSIVRIRRPKIAEAIFPCPRCAMRPLAVASDRSPRASMAFQPTAANAPPSRPIARSWLRAARPMAPTPRCSCRIARFVIRA